MRLRALALTGLSTVLLTACSSTIEGSASPAVVPPGAVESGGAGSSGAGSSDRSGPELEELAISALEEAGSVRVAGSMTVDGEQGEVDLRLRGEDVAGTMTVLGSSVEIVVVDGLVYMRASADFWIESGAPAAIARGLADTWVMAPAGTGDEFGDLTVAGLVDEMRSPGATTDEEVGEAQLDGEPVWELTNSDGDVMLVAAEGTPYPLQITSTGAEPGVMRLSEFGTVAPIEPPADYVDLEDLGG
ncbi:hypothetical protein [Blastococcus sp. TF02A-26]|uniref:hypothetical protein n=1 Tax=Blastococcus sp. TF02A-26 TaxID=2250577 RepID=UPI000DEAF2E6|nr:hypothetical protein [Blastococcus sp. TF02A-26]RBY79953.1 hypothetical protein DQ240_21925 [Blastococcus sp. TF02A-26]